MAKEPVSTRIDVAEIDQEEIQFNILGTSPLLMHRYQQKAWQQLLFPSEAKNRAERAQTMKHVPVEEFRGALYRNRSDKEPSLIHLPPGAIHGALASAALDIPGAKKSQIERLTQVIGTQINLFGVPQLFMSMVRNSDMNRTPDVRTRPLFPEWACTVTIRYTQRIITERAVASLLGAAGMIVGIGDWRPQKGGGYGCFQLVDDKDEDFKRIVKTQARDAQLKAFEKPECFDLDTEELLAWYESEVIRRETDRRPSAKARKDAVDAATAKVNGTAPPAGKRGVVTEGRHGNVS
jgi:hypothetical protein